MDEENKEVKIRLKSFLIIITICISVAGALIAGTVNEFLGDDTKNNKALSSSKSQSSSYNSNSKEYEIEYFEDSGIGEDDWIDNPERVNGIFYESNGFSSISVGTVTESAADTTGASGSAGGIFSSFSGTLDSSSVTAESNLGFSTGGAKDINNFRENIEEGYFPISTDITYNGLFYDYYFDTANDKIEKSEDLFSPSYSTAVSQDPFSDETEYYMTVGLNSNIKESDFQRKKLNLVVTLDISGSMSSGFNSYYYDMEENEDIYKTKMQIANESVNILIDQLNEEDKFGMVLFESDAYKVKPMNPIGKTNVNAIKNHILDILPTGGTNFDAGYTVSNQLFDELEDIDKNEYENRIIVITDAMPNLGDTSKDGLLAKIKANADKGIYTTFIGVDVDFNTELTEKLSDVKGANYYSVHSSEEFKERMGEQFEFMVTPLVFDLNLDLESEDYEIESVYGSDTKEFKDGNVMKINTLFPSKSSNTGEVKGGVVLLKLKKISDNDDGMLKLKVSYENRAGEKFENTQEVEFSSSQNKYDNTGIRKAILLTRYVNCMKNWILYERTDDKKFLIAESNGIIDCMYTEDEVVAILGEHERTSQKIAVSKKYKEVFKQFQEYMKEEIAEIGDDTLNQEIDVIDKILDKAGWF